MVIKLGDASDASFSKNGTNISIIWDFILINQFSYILVDVIKEFNTVKNYFNDYKSIVDQY